MTSICSPTHNSSFSKTTQPCGAATAKADFQESNMAQNQFTNYLMVKKEKITVEWNMKMVQKNLSESEESDCECSTEGECVVDGMPHPELSGSFKKAKESQVLIQSLQNTTIRPDNIKPKRKGACMRSSTSDITIYYYKSNMLDDLEKGVPVVLNMGESDLFLKCTFNKDKAVLSLECSDKDKLDSIFKNDPTTWPFVFYLTHTKDDCRHFESAECIGWFIHTESDFVCMDKQKDKDSEKYSFNIICTPNTSKKVKN